jgi:hypothetical protein
MKISTQLMKFKEIDLLGTNPKVLTQKQKGRGGDLPPALPTRYLIGGNFFNRPWRTSSTFFTNWMMTLAIPSETRYFCERFHVLRPLKLLHLLT